MMHWANIESQPRELATTNDTNMSMTKKFDANVQFPPQETINCMGLNHITSTLNMLLHHKYVCPPLLIQIMLMHKIKFCLPMDFIRCFKK
jgi:hypothetical protein